ncbi:MAG: ROK family protein [Acidimicrobiia bacterium]|nr:ROK family protein [Acidimicrobiia bacterium]
MRIGIDLGGTKIEGRAFTEQGDEQARLRIATPAGDYAAIVDAVAGLVADMEAQLGAADSVGIGTPGAIDPVTLLMKNSNSTALNGMPLDVDIEAALGRPIRMANDADCMAVSEAVDGAAEGAAVVFGVIVGTGVGGGIVANGRLLRGPNRITGEWGHNGLPWLSADESPGPDCYCGRTGCVETFLSGPGLERDHLTETGEELSAAEVAVAASAGDESAGSTMDRYHDRLARAVANVINILDPDVIVLGGGVSNIDSIYEEVPRIWGNYVFSDQVLTKLVKAKHGDSSGVRGAAWLWRA